MRQNWNDIPEIINFCNLHQIPITFNRVWTPSNCSIWGSSQLIIDEILTFYKLQVFPLKTEIERGNASAFNDLKNLLEQWKQQEKIKQLKNHTFQNIPLTQLELMVFEHVLSMESDLQISEIEQKGIYEKLENVLNKFRDHDKYKMLLQKLIEIPSEILRREFLNNSITRLEQQIIDVLK